MSNENANQTTDQNAVPALSAGGVSSLSVDPPTLNVNVSRPESEAGKKPTKYDSDDGDDDEVPKVIDQHRNRHRIGRVKASETRVDLHKGDAPVMYSARVFDTVRNLQNTIEYNYDPVAQYVDREPIQLVDSQPTGDDGEYGENHPESPTLEEDESAKRQWQGKIIEIEVFVHARIPKVMRLMPATSVIGPRARPMRESVAKYPKLIEDLVIERVSQYRIYIKSRLLYGSLMKIIEYSPTFRQSDLLAATRSQGLVMNEPFAPLMHHFELVKKFVTEPDVTESQVVHGYEVPNADEVSSLKTRKHHMKYLYDYIEPLYQEVKTNFDEHIMGDSPRVLFSDVWFLFYPGRDVYFTLDGIVRQAVVMGTRKWYDEKKFEWGIWRGLNEHLAWVVEMWYLFSDGDQLLRRKVEIKVWAYSGPREVRSFEICPTEMWDRYDGGVRRKKILERSKFAIEALRHGHLLAFYDGPTLSSVKEAGGDGKRSYSGKIIIDQKRGLSFMTTDDDDEDENDKIPKGPLEDFSEKYRSYDGIPLRAKKSSSLYNHAPPSPAGRDTAESTDSGVVIDGDELTVPRTQLRRVASSNSTAMFPGYNEYRTDASQLTEHQLLLLDPELRGFTMKTKAWVAVQSDYLQKVYANRDSFDRLVLGPGERRTIEAISMRHNLKNQTWAADYIEGKGTGQIVLLHGPPGVGKTYTVEAITEWLNRPLIALTIADIGTTEVHIERELVKWFSLAEAWNAVVLVDEAEIFLETREHRDLSRNGLVSAFLRRLEYFEGLIFMTTNRPGQIDDAFISRIHVAINYKPLESKDRQEIWRGFFRKLATERKGKIRVATGAKNWVLKNAEEAQSKLNGRDIRNALQTAITLAEYASRENAANDPDYDPSEEIIVEESHFKDVLDMSDRFRKDLERMRGEDEMQAARGRRDRNDYPAKVTEVPMEKLNFGR